MTYKYFYQVKLFSDDTIEGLENKMNAFLKTVEPRVGFTPSIRLVDSGSTAMVMYMIQEENEEEEEEEEEEEVEEEEEEEEWLRKKMRLDNY